MVKRISKSQPKKKTIKRKSRPTPFLQTVNSPAAYGMVRSQKRTMPVMAATPSSCIVKNFELVGGFATPSADFDITSLQVNPGVVACFPWLSGIATNYQKFRWRYLKFFFSTSVPTSASGKAFLQLQYDTIDNQATTFAQVMAGDSAAAGPTWFGGAINEAKAFDNNMNADSNIYVVADNSKMPNDWYYVRATAALSAHVAMTGTATGGNGTLAVSAGSYLDEAALPCRINYGSQASLNSAAARVSPGDLYVAYIVELAEPVAPALAL